jgi:hypothetical protein
MATTTPGRVLWGLAAWVLFGFMVGAVLGALLKLTGIELW